MKKALIVLMAGLLLLTACQTQTGGTDSEGQGRFVATVTDAAANMESVSSIRATVERVEVQSQSEGWVTVSSEPKTYDLLELEAEGRQALLADAQLEEGTYNQIRLQISEATVVDNEGEHEARMPSGVMRFNANAQVRSEQTTTATFDFQADESLHVTGKGDYILAPVVQVETRSNAEVNSQNENNVVISGGQTTTRTKVGMDLNGNVGVNVRVPANANISIGSDGRINVRDSVGIGTGTSAEGQGRVVVGITDAAADMGSVSEIEVTVDEINAHSQTEGWVVLTSEDKTYDLLQLQSEGKIELAVDTEVNAGTYDQVRLEVKEVFVTDDEGTKEATIPSSEMKIFGDFNVEEDSTTSLTFDFQADESLHTTGQGRYILAPVVQFEAMENAEVNIGIDSSVNAEGRTTVSQTVGMDAKGNVGANVKIPSNAKLSVNSAGRVSVLS